jgi:uncharacterized protein (TIGR03000 family)
MVMCPVYGPGGVYYVPYYAIPASSANSSSTAQKPAASSKANAAAPSGSNSQPSYYSEDYKGPQEAAKETSNVAYIRVRVPAKAQLWINNEKRKQAGTVREFVTPELDPEHIYSYNVKARWTEEGGIEVEKTLRVRAISGTRVTVNFVRPPEAQPRPAAPAPVVAAAPQPRQQMVRRQPVDWTSGNVAPRSFRQGVSPP